MARWLRRIGPDRGRATAAASAAMEFDHIVVGAGSAGCVLARRLAETGATVLLLEAGGDDARLSLRVPIGYGRSFYDRRVNWMYRTESETALAGREGYWPRGRVLGGSSAINAMVYMRGLPQDFDDWRDAGNPGWGWDEVLPHFRRLERYDGPGSDDRATRGGCGPLHVSDVSAACHPLCMDFLRACEQVGIRRSADLNGADPEGVAHYQITTRRGLRMSAARAFLPPGNRPTGLRVELHAHVLRIMLDGRRAMGVVYRRGGAETPVRARRGVILAAGAIASPMLLQLSGIGQSALLAQHGIPVAHPLPAVGSHLQDHLCIDYLYRARVPTLNQELGQPAGQIRAALRYALFRAGPLALSVNQAGGLVRSGPDRVGPDLQLYFSPLSYTRAAPGRRALMRPDRFPGFLLSAQPCRPFSRGRIEITSPDPLALPRIAPGSLSDPRDVEMLLRGARLLRRIAAAPALTAVIDLELTPGAAATSDAAMVEDIRARAGTVFHPVGTCRMGGDPNHSVVDARLRVHGLDRLWIADASVFPFVTSANTNAPVMMVAEKAATMIEADGGRA